MARSSSSSPRSIFHILISAQGKRKKAAKKPQGKKKVPHHHPRHATSHLSNSKRRTNPSPPYSPASSATTRNPLPSSSTRSPALASSPAKCATSNSNAPSTVRFPAGVCAAPYLLPLYDDTQWMCADGSGVSRSVRRCRRLRRLGRCVRYSS